MELKTIDNITNKYNLGNEYKALFKLHISNKNFNLGKVLEEEIKKHPDKKEYKDALKAWNELGGDV